MLYLDIKYFLADHNLNYTDKLSMAHGIEVRVPYLDKDLVELTTQIPISLKMKGQTTKFILRKIAEGEISSLGDTSTLLDPLIVDEIKAGKV